MAQYSKEDISISEAKLLCFASTTMLSPADIHGDKTEALPMFKVSALARMLAEKEPKLPLAFSANILKAIDIFQQTKRMPFVYIQLRDGRLISSFFVRRHTHDPVSDFLIGQSCMSLFTFIIKQVISGQVIDIALERPVDATNIYDKAVAMLPDNVTIHREKEVEND